MGVTRTKLGEKPVVILPELQFYTKKKRYARSDNPSDVYVSITSSRKGSSGKETISINFIFRNKLYEILGSEYIVFAQMKNRIYFKAVDKTEGYHLTIRESGLNAVVKVVITKDDLPDLEPFAGKEYSLKYDDFYELYYIQLDNEENI